MAVSKCQEQIFLFLELFNPKLYLEVLYLIFEGSIGERKIKGKMKMDASYEKVGIFFHNCSDLLREKIVVVIEKNL